MTGHYSQHETDPLLSYLYYDQIYIEFWKDGKTSLNFIAFTELFYFAIDLTPKDFSMANWLITLCPKKAYLETAKDFSRPKLIKRNLGTQNSNSKDVLLILR